MAIPADRMVAVDVPVTVYEVIHVAVMPLAVHDDILKIKLSRFREQREKFVRYILFRSEVMQMPSSFKKRDNFLFCPFMSNYLFMGLFFNNLFCQYKKQLQSIFYGFLIS